MHSTFTATGVILIAIVTLVSGLIPIYRHASAAFYNWSEAAVGGLFIGAGLFHLLPDAAQSFALVYPGSRFPFAYVVFAATFAILFAIEFGIHQLQEPTKPPHSLPVTPDYLIGALVVIALSIHSLIGGMALGLNQQIGDTILIFLIILVHKATDSFALVINLRQARFTKKAMTYLMIIFATMTPLGMIAARSLILYLPAHGLLACEAIFSAIAASLFLYIGTLEGVGRQLLLARKPPLSKLFLMVTGMGIMGLLAVWV